MPSGPVSGDASGRCSGLVVHTLGRWRSTEVARPGPLEDASAGWIVSSTTSTTSSGPR